jgi:hypothetical protein
MDEKFMNGLANFVDTKIKEALKNYIDIYQVTEYNQTTGRIKIRGIHDKVDEDIEILDTSTGLGDKKQITTGYAPGDIVLVLEIKGTKIILGSMFNDFFKEKDRKLIPESNQTIIKSNKGFKILNKDGYGIECDESGNITIRGLTINHTQTVSELNYVE